MEFLFFGMHNVVNSCGIHGRMEHLWEFAIIEDSEIDKSEFLEVNYISV